MKHISESSSIVGRRVKCGCGSTCNYKDIPFLVLGKTNSKYILKSILPLSWDEYQDKWFIDPTDGIFLNVDLEFSTPLWIYVDETHTL